MKARFSCPGGDIDRTDDRVGVHDRTVGAAVRAEDDGIRIDRYLARQYPFFSREQWKALCESRQVKVNTRPVRSDYRLRSGDLISRVYTTDDEPSPKRPAAVIADFGDIVAVNKPAGIPVHETGRFFRHTLREWLKEELGPGWEAVHRLDRETSGIVLVAKDPNIRRQLSDDLVQHRIFKSYLAILDGVLTVDHIVVTAPIGELAEQIIPKKTVSHEHGRPAKSTFKVLARAPGQTLAEVVIETGRSAQIRVHAASLGHPVHHDGHYGQATRRLIDRQALHAHVVRFDHPTTGRPVVVECPLPDDMLRCWENMMGRQERLSD